MFIGVNKALTLVEDETIFILTILCFTNNEKSCKMLIEKKGGDYIWKMVSLGLLSEC